MKSLFTTSIAAYSLFFAPIPLHAAEISVDVRFSSQEASIIRQYYRQYPVSNSTGKKGRKSLPPGIAKNLARGKPLPPGIAKQMLPGALLSQLPPPRNGFERVIVDGKILLVEIATQAIHDVLVDAIIR